MKYEKFLEYERRAYSTVYSEQPGGFHDDIIVELAQKFLPSLVSDNNGLIVDIGCGPGMFMEAARNLGYDNLLGVTLSDTDHAVCANRGFQTVKASMSDLDLDDGCASVIWCRHALEHSPFPLFTLYEFYRVLSDQGRVFIEVPAPDNARLYMHEFNPNHYSIMGDKMWLGLFEKAGFDLLNDYVYCHQVNFENRLVDEKSYLFVLKKSDEDIATKFFKRYNLKIS